MPPAEGDLNMTLLVIGADNIKAFVPKLNSMGAEEIIHWSGRNVQDARNTIPSRTDMVLFFTDFLNHNAARALKHQLKKRDLPILYCRRAWSEIHQEMERLAPRHTGIKNLNSQEDAKRESGCSGCGCGGSCDGGENRRCRARNIVKHQAEKSQGGK
jgi:hypothetical protein